MKYTDDEWLLLRLDRCSKDYSQSLHVRADVEERAAKRIRELLAEKPAGGGEPVAWQLPGTDSIITAEMKAYRGVLAETWTVPLYANVQPAPTPAALAKSMDRECTDPQACTFHRRCLGKCCVPLVNANTALKLRATDARAAPPPAPAPKTPDSLSHADLLQLRGKS